MNKSKDALTMTTTPTTGAEMPEALRLADKLDSLCVAEFAWPTLRAASSELRRLHALGAAAPAVAPADLITIRKPTTPAEVAWLAKLAHLLVSDVNKTLDEVLVSAPRNVTADEDGALRNAAQRGAVLVARGAPPQQGETAGAVYAELPEPALSSTQCDSTMRYTTLRSFSERQMREFADATCALRAAAPHAAAASGAPVAAAPMSAEPSDAKQAFNATMRGIYGNEFPGKGAFAGERGWSDEWAIFQAGMALRASPTTVQAVSGLEEERALFKEQYRHLDLAESPDAWGRPKFTHSRVDALWNGWRQRAAVAMLNAGASGGEAQAEGDAKDAALWREHVGKLDALVTYCPTCCDGFKAKPEMTRDEVIFECGKTAGRGELKAVRAALQVACDHIEMEALRVSHCKDAATIDIALAAKSQKGGAA